jgi:hypothetical protein
MLFFINDSNNQLTLIEILRQNYTNDGAYYKAIMKSRTICKNDKTVTFVGPAAYHHHRRV